MFERSRSAHIDGARLDYLRRRWRRADAVRGLWRKAGLLPPSFEQKYDPDQPRVPAGNPGGGQWTSGGTAESASSASDSSGNKRKEIIRDESGEETWEAIRNEYRDDGSLARQIVINRDGSGIDSDFSDSPEKDGWDEQHTVVLPDNSVVTFENSGDTQTIRDGAGNQLAQTTGVPENELQPSIKPASFAPALLGAAAVAGGAATLPAAAALYNWWSSQNAVDGRRAILSLHADAFIPGATNTAPAIRVDRLTSEQVQDVCPRVDEVQSITNWAASTTDRGAFKSAGAYGSAVHKKIADEINGPATVPRSPPRDPNFRAEVSLIASDQVHYAKSGSTRLDVLENPGQGTVCVHEIKTGNRGMSAADALRMAREVQFFYPGTLRMIINQIRPSR